MLNGGVITRKEILMMGRVIHIRLMIVLSDFTRIIEKNTGFKLIRYYEYCFRI